MKLTTPIIPSNQILVGASKTIDYEAICVFAATGFFLDQDTYFNELKALKSGYNYKLDNNREKVLSKDSYFKWHHSPINRPFEDVVNEFENLFESIIAEQVSNKDVILPLSGGLDSRTLAVAIHHLGINTSSFSYKFKGGHDETWYGKQIARICGFKFKSYTIPEGYLWDVIDELPKINGYYSEFTHPRQMAFINEYSKLGEVFSLGHWGDVLFDDMGVPDNLDFDKQVDVIIGKVVKKGGMELAESLWNEWELKGDFKSYLRERIQNLLQKINIPNSANAQIRAFKSLYWAPRWTNINLSVFESVRPVTLPYFDNRMCEFICTVPEEYLAGRKIQIAYIKKRMPKLAKLTWQAQRPFNLYNYKYNRNPFNLPYKVYSKINRTLMSKKYIQRNWELQFVGDKNDKFLNDYLFNTNESDSHISMDLTLKFYQNFKSRDAVEYSHSISMLLTLSEFFRRYHS